MEENSYLDFLFGMLINNDDNSVKINDFLGMQIKPGKTGD
jgi:hypothetical protein